MEYSLPGEEVQTILFHKGTAPCEVDMSQDAVERFLGRAITDEQFRSRAQMSLDQCCLSEGLGISHSEAAFLAKLDFRLFDIVATHIDDAIRRH